MKRLERLPGAEHGHEPVFVERVEIGRNDDFREVTDEPKGMAQEFRRDGRLQCGRGARDMA